MSVPRVLDRNRAQFYAFCMEYFLGEEISEWITVIGNF
jgi:hypothetical protein